MKNTIRTALLCGALAFSTSAFAQVGGAVSGTAGAATSATPPAATSTTNAAGQISTPSTSVNGAANTSVSTDGAKAGINAHTATPAKSRSSCDPAQASRIPCHSKASPTSDTRVNTGVSTPNASSNMNTNVTTNPNGAKANTSTNTDMSTPQPH